MIAGSLRNVSRYSVVRSVVEVEHWMGKGAYKLTNPSQTPNTMTPEHGSETTGDELRWSKGKQPRSPAKVPESVLSGKGCGNAQTTRRLA